MDAKTQALELKIIIPVYNEVAAIQEVLNQWCSELSTLKIAFEIHVYNDGSKDNTLQILTSYVKNNPRVIIHDKLNSGHGPTILMGYRQNSDVDWLFHVDSDDEMGPDSFHLLWAERENFDFLIGQREGRNSPLPRKIISLFSRLAVKTFYGTGVWDVNSPYRLFRVNKFKKLFQIVPDDTFAPNVILSGLACLYRYKIKEIPVIHNERKTGIVSIRKWKLLKVAIKSFFQTISFRFHVNAAQK